jgi:hypothetical protein
MPEEKDNTPSQPQQPQDTSQKQPADISVKSEPPQKSFRSKLEEVRNFSDKECRSESKPRQEDK